MAGRVCNAKGDGWRKRKTLPTEHSPTLKELQESVWEQHRRNVRPGLQDAEPAGKLRPGAPLQKKGKMLNTSKDVSLCMKKTGNHSELKGHTTSDTI